MLKANKAQIGFKWKDASSSPSRPSVRIWSGSPNLQTLDYLRDNGVALSVIVSNNTVSQTSNLVAEGATTWLRPDLMNEATSDTVNLLLEGVTAGTGKLVLVIKVGAVEAEGPGIDFKLVDVRQMYERAKITKEAPQVPDAWTVPSMPQLAWTWDPWLWRPEIDKSADPTTIAYVHGWRMTYNEYLQWADTTYKSLWQLGYKGRFYAFHWPTYDADNHGLDISSLNTSLIPPGALSYNPSEYRAWLSGPALASFVNGLPNPNARYLIAHSMGNVVAGSALLNNMQVTRYAMCNSAMAGMAYNGNIQDQNFPYTPDTDADPGTRAMFGLADKLKSVPTKIINFNLGPDHALDLWDLNNRLFKPQPFIAHSYAYFPGLIPRQKFQYGIPVALTWTTTKIVTEVPEAMGYVTQARSHAAGSYQHLGNSVMDDVNMSDFGFGSEHSAEWIYSIQATYPFWKDVLKQFNINVTD